MTEKDAGLLCKGEIEFTCFMGGMNGELEQKCFSKTTEGLEQILEFRLCARFEILYTCTGYF